MDLPDREVVSTLTSAVLILTLVVAVGGLVVYVVTPLSATKPFTEFYVLGEDGHATDYPSNLSVDEPETFIVGIQNHEHQSMTYTVIVETRKSTLATRQAMLSPGERWEDTVSVSFDSPGEKRLAIELYVGPEPDGEPYHQLRLVVTVTPDQ